MREPASTVTHMSVCRIEPKVLSDFKAYITSNKRIPELDGLRGGAILLVVIFHYIVQRVQTVPGTFFSYSAKYASNAWIGVDVFFVLSGFLVGGILLDQKSALNCMQVFYIRRCLRIVPLYLVFLAMFFVAVWANNISPRQDRVWLLNDPFPFWTYALYLQNLLMACAGTLGPSFANVTWSLAIEEQFYMLFPFMVVYLSRKKLLYALLFLIVCAPVVRVLLYFYFPFSGKVAAYVLLPARWDSLLLGVLAAWLVRDLRGSDYLSRFAPKLRIMVIGGMLGVAAMPFIGCFKGSLSMLLVGHLWIGCTIFLLLLHLVTGERGIFSRILRSNFLQYFGKISYSVYLFHVGFLGAIFSIVKNKEPNLSTIADWAIMSCSFMFTIAFAHATWILFEDRLIKLGHKIQYTTL